MVLPPQLLALLQMSGGRVLYGAVVKAVVMQKVLVFAGHYGHGHGGRDALKRHPVMVQPDVLAVAYLLETAYEHEWRKIDRHEAVGHYG